jgi:hypothetical protein
MPQVSSPTLKVAPAPLAVGLSKSRYVAGLQCPKMLWWQVHD